jgi:hypothetical protein
VFSKRPTPDPRVKI